MTKTWITQTFPARDNNQVAVYADGNSETWCDVDILATTISAANTYADLCALSITSQGWQKIFDQWKGKGFVN